MIWDHHHDDNNQRDQTCESDENGLIKSTSDDYDDHDDTDNHDDPDIIISQIYCNYIYTSKELYDMENREASDLEAVRAEKE